MKKRILSVLLALSLLAGLGGPAGAEELTRGENTVRVENAEGSHSQNEKKFDLMVQGELDQYLKEHPEQDGTNSEYRNANFRTRAAAPLALAGTTSADLVVETAREMIGDSGVPNTYTYWMGAIDGSYAYAWCHAFVSWAAAQAGAGSIIPKTASCFIGMNWFVNRGRFRYASSGYVPLKGDIIYFDWDNGYGTIDHVGIVDRVSNGIVYTIEGNTTNSVRGRTYQLTDSSIVGYGIPEYDYRGEDSSNGGASANSLGTGSGSAGTGSGNTSVTAGNQGSSSAEPVDSCHCTSSYQGLYKCTATKSPLTIRKGHGTDFAVLGSIPIGASGVQVTKADGTWAHVTYNGVSGYCYMYFLEKTTSASPLPHCACNTGSQGFYKCNATKSPLTIRSGHGTNYDILGRIPCGAENVYVSKSNGEWAHVIYGNIQGYCSMQYLTKTQEIKTSRTPCVDKLHSWDKGKVTKEPTFLAEGVKTITCTACGSYRTEKVSVKAVPAPVILYANNQAGGVMVAWKPVKGVTSYEVYRKMAGETKYTKMAAVKGESTVKWMDAKVQHGKKYYYAVYAVCTSGSKSVRSKSSAYKETVYHKALNLAGISNAGKGVALSWKQVSGASGYLVYRRKGGENSFTKIRNVVGGKVTSWTDTTAAAGAAYQYRIRSYVKLSNGNYYYGPLGSAKTIRRLTAPVMKTISAAKLKNVLTWNPVKGAGGYQIYRLKGSETHFTGKAKLGPGSLSWTDSDVKAGEKYTYAIRAFYTASGVTYYSPFTKLSGIVGKR